MEALILYEAVYPVDEGIERDFLLSNLVRWGIRTSSRHDLYVREQLDQEFLKPHQSWVITQNKLCKKSEFDETSDIKVTTRVTQANRFFIQRFYEYFQQGVLIATMTTQFVAIDLETRRLARLTNIQKDLEQVLVPEYKQTLPQLKPSTPSSNEEWDDQFEPMIEDGDIDENNHVNNLIYLRWVLNQMSPEDRQSIKQVDIKYSQELMADDQVMINMKKDDEVVEYFIYKNDDQSLAAYIQLTY